MRVSSSRGGPGERCLVFDFRAFSPLMYSEVVTFGVLSGHGFSHANPRLNLRGLSPWGPRLGGTTEVVP